MDSTTMASLVFNAVIALFTAIALVRSVSAGGADDQTIAARAFSNLKYYTVLSNLFSGFVAVLFMAAYLHGSAELPLWMLLLKLTAAASVLLTFLVVIFLLSPVRGLKSLYSGPNLWLHCILPLLCLVDSILFVPVEKVPLSWMPWVVVPTALYAMYYLTNIRRYGAEEDGVVYDIYGFLRWGEKKAGLVAICLTLSSLLNGLVIHLLANLVDL